MAGDPLEFHLNAARTEAVCSSYCCGFTAALAWSAVHPHDYFTWALEIFPAFLALAALAITYRRFQFTTFVYL